MEALTTMGTADLVLFNWIPHERDDLDLITRLRRRAVHEPVVILLATGEPGVRDLQSALRAGANDYLMKPFTSMQIDEKLLRFGLSTQSRANCDK
jgi:PleD family two-component response regulator